MTKVATIARRIALSQYSNTCACSVSIPFASKPSERLCWLSWISPI